MKDKITTLLKWAGSMVLGIIFIVGMLLLFGLLVGGTVEIYVKYLSGILADLDGLAFALAVVFLFLCIFRKCRVFAGTALVFCSYAIAMDLWFQSLTNTYAVFGVGGVFIGVVLFGVGVYLTGLVALLWAHVFGAFLTFVISLAIMFGIRLAGLYIAQKETERRYNPDLDEPDADGTTGRMLGETSAGVEQ